jgi:hypothetical protein
LPSSGEGGREARAAKIEARLQQSTPGVSSDTATEVFNERRRQEVIGRCEEMYARRRETAPFGLRSMPLDKLVALEARLRSQHRG